MKYTIYWTEYHNPLNWGDTEEEGIKEICDSLPMIRWWHDSDDGWIGVECEDTFEAETDEEAKEIVKDVYDEVETFNVFRGNDYTDTVFTEEDV